MKQNFASKEKRAILIHRILWLSIFVFCYILSLAAAISYGVNIYNIYKNKTPVQPTLVSSSGKVNDFIGSSYTNYTLTLNFSEPGATGSVSVTFYNFSGTKLETRTESFSADGKTATIKFSSVSGFVKSFEIKTCYIEPVTASPPSESALLKIKLLKIWFETSVKITLISIVFFAMTLLQTCRVYGYKNSVIIIYSGWFYRYVSVDGVKVDEHNTLINFTPIYMSAVLYDETRLNVTITLTNRISLKINDILYNGEVKER